MVAFALPIGLSLPGVAAQEKIFKPIAVSTISLRFHQNSIPDRLLVLRGYFSRLSETGVPTMYSTRDDAKMLNDSSGFPVSFFEKNSLGEASVCEEGFAKAYGYLDREFDVFRVFVLIPFSDVWAESDPCWATSFDWKKHPDYRHLIPG